MAKRPHLLIDDGMSSFWSAETANPSTSSSTTSSSSAKRSRSSLFSSALSIDIPEDATTATTSSTAAASEESECDTPPRPGWTQIGGGKFGSVWHDGFADVAVKCVDRGKLSARAREATFDDVGQFRRRIEEVLRRSSGTMLSHMALPVPDSIEASELHADVVLMQLPFVAGQTLRTAITVMSGHKLREIVCDVITFLNELNALGIYHNDVTVNNIIVTPFDDPGWVLVDWDAVTIGDVARLLDNLNLKTRWSVKDVEKQRPDVVHFMIHLMQFTASMNAADERRVDFAKAILECPAARATIDACKDNGQSDEAFLEQLKTTPEMLVFSSTCLAQK